MVYKGPKERMQVSLRRKEVDDTGLPRYNDFSEVPPGYVTKTTATKLKQSIVENEAPAAFVLARAWNGYLPLYFRPGLSMGRHEESGE